MPHLAVMNDFRSSNVRKYLIFIDMHFPVIPLIIRVSLELINSRVPCIIKLLVALAVELLCSGVCRVLPIYFSGQSAEEWIHVSTQLESTKQIIRFLVVSQSQSVPRSISKETKKGLALLSGLLTYENAINHQLVFTGRHRVSYATCRAALPCENTRAEIGVFDTLGYGEPSHVFLGAPLCRVRPRAGGTVP